MYLNSFSQLISSTGKRAGYILATDADEAGGALRRELARRLSLARCWEVVSWDAEPATVALLPEAASDELWGADG
jgi:hypothetical protein